MAINMGVVPTSMAMMVPLMVVGGGRLWNHLLTLVSTFVCVSFC